MVGIFGYWNGAQIQAFGTINYDSSICPRAEPEPEIVEEEVVESQDWWEIEDSESSEDETSFAD